MTEKSSFLVRLISSIIMFLIFFVMIFSNDLLFIFMTQIILFLTNWELLRLLEFKKYFKAKNHHPNFFLSRCKITKYDFILICIINLFVLFFFFSYEKLQVLSLIFFFIIFWKFFNKNFIKLFSILYILIAFIFLIALRFEDYFIECILFIVFFSMIVDASALIVGRKLGGPKLSPTISPNKTISGFVAGIIFPLTFCLVIYSNENNIMKIIISSVILSLISQFGDLLESKFKRYCNVKDSSNLIPGHGGVLDRIDSILLLIIFVSLMNLFGYNFFFIV